MADLASARSLAGDQLGPCPADPDLTRALDSLQRQDPLADAGAAIKRKDYRYWAVQGYVTVVPGIVAPLPQIEKRVGLRVFERTSDAIIYSECEEPDGRVATDSTHAMWQTAAYGYALAYNQELQRLHR